MINAIDIAVQALEKTHVIDETYRVRITGNLLTLGDVVNLLRMAVIMGKEAKQVPPTHYPEQRKQYVSRLLPDTVGLEPEVVKYLRAKLLFVYPELDNVERYQAGKWLEVTSKQLQPSPVTTRPRSKKLPP